MTQRAALSLTARLAILFAVATIATFALVGTYLYKALATQLQHRDDMELISKSQQIRYLLRESTSIAAIRQEPQRFLNAMYGQDEIRLQLLQTDGQLIMQSGAPSHALPSLPLVPATRHALEKDVSSWDSGAGTGRVIASAGMVGMDGLEPVHIVIAREGASRSAMMRKYGETLAVAVWLGAMLAAMLGFLVVQLGLRPLRLIITQANAISTQRLHTRLSNDNTPRELHELGQAFNAMLDRLEDGVKRLTQFASDIAHDLRTPVNTLMVETQVALTKERSNEEYQILLGSNLEEYERLARIIENTLFLARADNAQLAMQSKTLDLAVELERIRDYFEGLAEDAGVRLTIAAAALTIEADPILFRRAVSNLVSNAIVHTPRGSFIHLSATTAAGNKTRVTVENGGPGIPAEHLPHIFERFYRGDAARAPSMYSAGLGLAIVCAIMRLHGGDAGVTSVAGEKTVFYLCFPGITQRRRRRTRLQRRNKQRGAVQPPANS
ncbi:Signal transduction histidine kinase [Oxalobacteraceae bacterium IMCC9480]|nr:Signal transduction histidine kinase [Oxalobacteraceae bacterium IMCC9480]NDP60597.1 heavy metal sensor histidine kinase [Oxalobacteraceae bacterium]